MTVENFNPDCFLNQLYLNLLDRLPDPTGYKNNIAAIERGTTRQQIIYSIFQSDEFLSKRKNWIDIHSSLTRIMGDDLEEFQNYAELLEIANKNNKFPRKLSDLNKFKAINFYISESTLLNTEKLFPGIGLLVNVLPLSKYGYANSSPELSFVLDNTVLRSSPYGSRLFIYAPLFKSSILKVRANEKIIFEISLNDVDETKSDGLCSVAIVGRFENTTSIGGLSLSFLSQLHEKHNCYLVDTRPDDSRWSDVDADLKFEKVDSSHAKHVDISIYTDVFSNGIDDKNYTKVPASDIKIAYVVFDSTHLPSWWVDQINDSFDAVITTSKWGKSMIENSGVLLPVFYLPHALDYTAYNTKKLRSKKNGKFRFGSIASYSERKNVLQLVNCFIECFQGMEDEVELIVHSPLNYGEIYNKIQKIISDKNATNVVLSSTELDDVEYANLINSFSVFVSISKGECYSIPPRQAMALGKPIILSAGHAHDEIIASGLAMSIPVDHYEPAVLEAFSNQKIGLQCCYSDRDICNMLRKAYFNYEEINKKSIERIEYANNFTHSALKYFYANIVAPRHIFLDSVNEITEYGVVTNSKSLYSKYLKIKKQLSSRVRGNYSAIKYVIPVHDGGFFSVFNTFISHFVWNSGREDVAAVIPDWRIKTLQDYRKVHVPMSFCYGTEADGNIFTKLFYPIPIQPLTESDYNNADYLQTNVQFLDDFNEKNEPLLTYIHARKLYKSKDFSKWRKMYGRHYNKYFKLRDTIKTEIEHFCSNNFKHPFIIGVHVKHPSHAIEQPNGFMPGVSEFIAKIIEVAERKNLSSYKIFLATDQDVVIDKFRSVFGERVVFRSNVARTTSLDDNKYKSLDSHDQLREGHQIQNLIAKDPSRWSLKMATDVIVDANILAKCNCFIHVTSNIATAVSYINPEIEMIYCE